METLHRFFSKRGARYFLVVLAACLLPHLLAAQSGRVQWVHASADSTLAVVDVYVDGVLTIDDFAYQTATPFMDPMIGSHVVALAPQSSSSVEDSLASFTVEIVNGRDYYAVIAGVLDPQEFNPNPDGRPTRVSLFVTDGARQASPVASEVSTRAFYGVTDLTAMTFSANSDVLYTGAHYGEFTEFNQASPSHYVVKLRASGRSSGSLLDVEADLSGLAGSSFLGVLSGFFVTTNGLGFEWLRVFPDGTTVRQTNLTEYSRVQLVHGSPDPAVETVDVYLDGSLLLDDFAFKTATSFMDLPSGYHEFHVAPATSTSSEDALKFVRPRLEADETAHAVFAGVLEPEAFKPNPDGRSTDLQLYMDSGALVTSDESAHPALRQFYGVPNLPAVTFTTEGIVVASSVHFGEFTHYAHPEPRGYVGSFSATGLATGPLYRIIGRFDELADQAVLSVFTGFFDAGSGITNFLVKADGTVIESQATTSTMRAQFVHASTDPALKTIDVYFDGIPLLVKHSFTRATSFVDLPSGVHEFAIAAGGSTSKNDAVETYRVSYQEGSSYSIVLAGVLDPDQFVSNPEGIDAGLNIFVTDDALEESTEAGEFSLRQFYGVINLPKSDFWIEEWGTTLFRDVSYGDFTEYTNGSRPGLLTGAVRPVGSPRNEMPILSTLKDWGGNQGRAILSVITGYTYDEHPGGLTADIHWFYVLADGRRYELDVLGTWTSTEDESEIPTSFAVLGNYPNPFNPATNIAFDLPRPAKVSIEIYDVAGRLVLTTSPVNMPAGNGQTVRINATAWSSGLYLYKVIARSGTSSWIGTGQMTLLK